MACIKWSQPILTFLGEMPSQQDIPLKKRKRELQNRSPFLPTTKPHPLNTLTHDPLPCISRVQVSGALILCASSTPSVFVSFCSSCHFCCSCIVWFCCIYLFVLILCGVKDAWAFGLVFSSSYPFLGWALSKQGPLPLQLAEPTFLPFFFMAVGFLAINLAILLYCVCYLFVQASLTALPCFCFLLPPQACWLVFLPCQPISLLPLSFGFLWPIYFFFTSYCSHGFIVLFLGLPRSIYYIFTSYYSYGLVGHHSCYVNPSSLSLYSLGFFGQFTSSLSLIVPMSLSLHSLGFLGPLTFIFYFLPLVTFMGLLVIIIVISAHWACYPIFSHFPYCGVSSAIEPSVKSGHQQSTICIWPHSTAILICDLVT